MAVRDGATEVPDSEEDDDELMTSSPLPIVDATDKLPPPTRGAIQASQGALQDVTCHTQASGEVSHSASSPEQALGVDRYDSSVNVDTSDFGDMTNSQSHYHCTPSTSNSTAVATSSAEGHHPPKCDSLHAAHTDTGHSPCSTEAARPSPSLGNRPAMELEQDSLAHAQQHSKQILENAPGGNDEHVDRPVKNEASTAPEANSEAHVLEERADRQSPHEEIIERSQTAAVQDPSEFQPELVRSAALDAESKLTTSKETEDTFKQQNEQPGLLQSDPTNTISVTHQTKEGLEPSKTLPDPNDQHTDALNEPDPLSYIREQTMDDAPHGLAEPQPPTSLDHDSIQKDVRVAASMVGRTKSQDGPMIAEHASTSTESASFKMSNHSMTTPDQSIDADTAELPAKEDQLATAITTPKQPSPAKTQQETTLGELRAQRVALIASLATLSDIQDLTAETVDYDNPDAEATDADIMSAANRIVKKHITLLHDYNEIKDVGQGLMGLIADQRGVRIVEVQDEFGITLKD